MKERVAKFDLRDATPNHGCRLSEVMTLRLNPFSFFGFWFELKAFAFIEGFERGRFKTATDNELLLRLIGKRLRDLGRQSSRKDPVQAKQGNAG